MSAGRILNRLNHINDAKWDVGGPPGHFDWQSFDYRVKPKKREVWLAEVDGVKCWGGVLSVGKAMEVVSSSAPGAIRFVEAD